MKTRGVIIAAKVKKNTKFKRLILLKKFLVINYNKGLRGKSNC